MPSWEDYQHAKPAAAEPAGGGEEADIDEFMSQWVQNFSSTEYLSM